MTDILATLLPLAVLALLVNWARRSMTLLDAVVPAALLWSLLAIASLEVLSTFNLINWISLFLFWLLSLVTAAGVRTQHQYKFADRSGIGLDSPDDLPFKALAAAAGTIVGITLIVGILSAPNTVDSLRYHLPRVEQWIQQRSLANFPTTDHRQLASNPLAEMLILHFRLLSESDWLDNLVQGLSFAGSVAAAAVVARRLGAARNGQILAAVMVATLPMAILQGSSTQNDFVVSFFLLAAAERLLAWRNSARSIDGLGIATAIGLAILTKGTAFFYAAPLGLAVLAIMIKRRRWRDVGLGAAMLALVLVINAGHLFRNARVILAPTGLVNTTASLDHSPRAVASSLLRNIASNFVTPSARLNDALVHGVEKFHRAIGIDINDPGTTLMRARFADLPRNVLNGDVAPNSLHLLLVFLAVAILGLELIRPANRPALPAVLRLYLVAVLVGGVLFCALLRWQPFIVRLQLPFFVLIAPPVAAILVARIRRPWLMAGGVCLIAAAVPFVICNQERPLYGNPVHPFANHFAPNIISADPWQLIFWDNPKRYVAVRKAVASVGDRARGGVGLIPYYDYAFWRMLKGDRFRNPVHIENVCLPKEYSKLYHYRPSTFQPSVVMTDLPAPPVLRCPNGVFDRESSFPTGDPAPTENVSVYRRRPD